MTTTTDAGTAIHPNRLVLAYFDETKKLRDAGTSVVFAGVAAHDDHWGEFNYRWGLALSGTGITALKMSSALACNGEFYGYKRREQARDELLFTLATVIHESPLLKVTCPMLAGDFESLHPIQQKKLKDQQYCGFEICVRGLLNHYPMTDVLQVACDLTEDYAHGCLRLFNLIRMREPDIKRRLLGISFGDDTFIAGLQAADMVAYCSRAKAEYDRFGQPMHPAVAKCVDLFESRGASINWYVYRAGSGGIGYAERE